MFIEIEDENGRSSVKVTGGAGLSLIVEDGEHSQKMISSVDAVDEDRFWQIHKRFVGELFDEDGNPFR